MYTQLVLEVSDTKKKLFDTMRYQMILPLPFPRKIETVAKNNDTTVILGSHRHFGTTYCLNTSRLSYQNFQEPSINIGINNSGIVSTRLTFIGFTAVCCINKKNIIGVTNLSLENNLLTKHRQLFFICTVMWQG